MKLKKRSIYLALVFFSVSASGLAQEVVTNHCKVNPDRSNALDYPEKHAWDLFISLNHPAVDEKIERGQADCSKPIGSIGATSVWETWRNGSTEVYLANGSEPPEWNDNSLPDAAPGKIPHIVGSGPEKSLNFLSEKQTQTIFSFHDYARSNVDIKFSPEDGVFRGDGGFGEVRMNRSTYEFIKRNCLWSKQGHQRYASAVLANKKPPISFPVDSIEVKPAWIDFEREGISEAKQKTYYIAEYEGKKYGLVALHIITKDIPNWFWATFHHVDAPHNEFETKDTYGRPKELNGTIWENYVLGGTQIDFVSPDGKPSILSDNYIEFDFQRSSCITCHATATIAADGSQGPNQAMAMCILNGSVPKIGLSADVCKTMVSNNLYKPAPDQDKLWEELGTPLGSWFDRDGKPYHFQTDFVWSIPFRSQNETSPPPARCIW